MLVAKWAYEGRKRDELSFKKRDKLELVEERGGDGWLIAKNASGEVGLVPGNYFNKQSGGAAPKKQKSAESAIDAGRTEKTAPTATRAAASAEEEVSVEQIKCPSCDQMVDLDAASSHQCGSKEGEERAVQLERQLGSLVATMEKEMRRSRAAHDDAMQQLLEEKQAHAAAVERATQLSALYEASVVQNDALLAENARLKAEHKALKTKTSRMVKLFKKQMKESGASTLKQENADLLDEVEELRAQLSLAKKSAKQQQRAASSGGSPGQPGAAAAAASSTRFVSGPPPPPPPSLYRPPGGSVKSKGSSGDGPSCPKCSASFANFTAYYAHEPCKGGSSSGGSMFDAIRGGVVLKKTPTAAVQQQRKRPANVPQAKPGSQASMAEMVAALARQRAANDRKVDAQLSLARSSLRK